MFGAYEKYLPEKELPEEIKSLPKEETKCKFCGVSYLVHHEVKALENQLREVQSTLDTFFIERKQLKEVESLKSQLNDLEKDGETRTKIYKRLRMDTLDSLQAVRSSVLVWKLELGNLKLFVNSLAMQQKEMCHLLFNETLTHLQAKSLNWKNGFERKLESTKCKAADEIERLETLLEGERLRCASTETDLSELQKNVNILQEKKRKLEFTNSEQLLRMQKCDDDWEKKLEEIIVCHQQKETALQDTIKLKDEEIVSLKHVTEEYKKEQTSSSKQILRVQAEYQANIAQHENEIHELKQLLKVQISEAEKQTRALNDFQKEVEKLKRQAAETLRTKENDFQKEVEKLKRQAAETLRTKENDFQNHTRKLNDEFKSYQSHLEEEIQKLKEQLALEKKKVQADILRHISQEKELGCQLHSTTRLLEESKAKLLNESNKLDDTKEENKLLKKQSESLTQHNEDLQNKLKISYSEISSLQTTVEKQCMERNELMKKIH